MLCLAHLHLNLLNETACRGTARAAAHTAHTGFTAAAGRTRAAAARTRDAACLALGSAKAAQSQGAESCGSGAAAASLVAARFAQCSELVAHAPHRSGPRGRSCEAAQQE